MKHLIRFLSLLLFIAAQTSLAQRSTVIKNEQKEGAEHEQERLQWIAGMHRAAPGVNWQQLDAATREARYRRLLLNAPGKKSFFSPLSIEEDTIAGGKLTGYWNERGSNNVCGRMHNVDIDFDHNAIYAASAMGNIWKASLNNTGQWRSLNDQFRFGEVRMLRVVTTTTGKRIIAMANQPAMVYFPNVPAEVYYSDDDGLTWQAATGLTGPKNNGGFKRGVITADLQTMYVFGSEWDNTKSHAVSTLYRSTNQGKNFTNIGKWDYDFNKCDIWISRETASSLYFLKGDSLFRLIGNSMSFIRTMTYSHPITSVGSLMLQGTVKNSVANLAVLETTSSSCSIFESSDGGSSWSNTGTFNGTPFGMNSFKMLPSDPHVLAIGPAFDGNSSYTAYISNSSGSSWNEVNGYQDYYTDETTNLHADVDGIDFITDPAGKEIEFFSTDGGIYMSTDGMASFQNITLTGIQSGQYYSVLTSLQPPYYIYAASQDQGIQITNDNASGTLGMTQILSGDYGHITSTDNGRSIWSDYPGFALYYPDAKGSSSENDWQFVGNNHLWMPPIVADPQNPQSAYIACGGSANQSYIWHLTNSGNSISQSQLPFDFSGGNNNRNISAIACSSLQPSQMYVLTNDGKFFFSNNTGSSWTQSNITAPASQYFYGSAILTSTKNPNLLWIAGSGYSNPGVYQSTDNGTTFTAMNTGLPNTLITSLAATDDEKFLFAATDLGAYIYSVDAGQWYDMTNGHAPDMVYWSVEYIPALKTVRFGTYGRGIWDFIIGQAPVQRNYTITSPKAGDIIQGNIGSYTIKYTSLNTGTQRSFEFSSDNGATWSAISASDSTNSSYTWNQVPNFSTAKGMIRVSDELGVIGVSGVFTIKAVIAITTPNAGDTIIGGTNNYSIVHTTFIDGTKNSFDFSSDGGSTWKPVIAHDSTLSTYVWNQVPDITTSKGIVRISDQLGVSGKSGIFSIVKKAPSPAFLTLNLGLTNNTIASGTSLDIHWTTNGSDFGSGFTVEYSTDGMQTWKLVQAVAASVMDIQWITPQGYFPHSFIRVRGTDIDKSTILKASAEFTIGNAQGVPDQSGDIQLALFPNPFSQTTTLRYTLSERNLVNLDIFDVMGRVVYHLISNKEQEQGIYRTVIDASHLPNGSYTYVFTAGMKRIVGAMNVIK